MSAKGKQVVEVQEKLEDITECPICTETYKEPKILPCIHTFCMTCLQQTGLKANKSPGDKMPCPICRTEFKVPDIGFAGMQRNFFMERLIEMKEILNPSATRRAVCDACQEENDLGAEAEIPSAVMYCVDCSQRLCEDCCKNHRKYKATKTHKMLSLENAQVNIPSNAKPYVCNKHENKPLEIYCTSCKEVSCSLCYFESHKTHETSPIIEVVGNFRRNIQENIDSSKSYFLDLKQKISEKDNCKELFARKVKDVKIEIKGIKENLKRRSERDCDSLLQQLDHMKQEKIKENEIQLSDIETVVACLESYQVYCKQVTTMGSDVDVCRVAFNLNTRAADLKQRYESMSLKSFPNIWLMKTEFLDSSKQFSNNIIGKIQECEDVTTTNLQSRAIESNRWRSCKAPPQLASSKTASRETTGYVTRMNILERESKRVAEFEKQRNALSNRIKECETHEQMLKKRVKDLEQQVDLLRRLALGEETEMKKTGTDWNAKEITYTPMEALREQKSQDYRVHGIAILENELFIVGSDGVVVINELKTLKFKRRWRIPFSGKFYDIKHCKTNKCLYMLCEKPKAKYEIVRIDPNGNIILTWSVFSAKGQISVTDDSNVLLTIALSGVLSGDTHELHEYKSNGELLRVIPLPWNSGIERVSHAIKLTSDHFLICHGNINHFSSLVRVCIVDTTGTVLKSYDDTLDRLAYPICMDIDGGGNTFIVDNSKQQVLLLNSKLAFERCLIDHREWHPSLEMQNFQTRPVNMCVDEFNGRILLVESVPTHFKAHCDLITVYSISS